MQLLKVAWYRVIALFTLYFLVYDTSIMILALPCNRGFSIQEAFIIEFVSALPQGGGFLKSTPVSSANKADCHDIAEILLKVVLNNINNQPTLESVIIC